MTREEAEAVSFDFRVDLETRRLHNKDPQRVWKGDSKHNHVAKNSTAMNQINETAYKKTKLEDANLAIDRNEWVNLVYSSSKEEEGRATFIILRSIRRANYNRRRRMGISTSYYQAQVHSKNLENKIYYYRQARAVNLEKEISLFEAKKYEQGRAIYKRRRRVGISTVLSVFFPAREEDLRIIKDVLEGIDDY